MTNRRGYLLLKAGDKGEDCFFFSPALTLIVGGRGIVPQVPAIQGQRCSDNSRTVGSFLSADMAHYFLGVYTEGSVEHIAYRLS